MFQERVGQWGKGVTVSWHRTKLIWGKLHPWPSHANSRIPWSWAIWVSFGWWGQLFECASTCLCSASLFRKKGETIVSCNRNKACESCIRSTYRSSRLLTKKNAEYRIPIDKIAKTNACISILIRLAYSSLSKWNERTIVVNRKILPFIEIVKW